MLGSFDSLNSALKLTETAISLVRNWNIEPSVASSISPYTEKVVEILLNVPGMTPAHGRDFIRATPVFTIKEEIVVKLYKNPVGVEHIFLSNSSREMVFGGFVGWIHCQGLKIAIEKIKTEFK